MIKRLQTKLIYVFSLTMAILVTFIIGISLYGDYQLQKEIDYSLFQTISMTVYSLAGSESGITKELVESYHDFPVYIQTDPQQYAGESTPFEESLFSTLDRYAKLNDDYGLKQATEDSVIRSSFNHIIQDENGNSYWGVITSMKDYHGDDITVSLLMRINYSQFLSKRNILRHLLVELITLSVLILLGRIMIAKAIEPIDENNRRQKQFVASASHDLKSPLAVIQASATAVTADNDTDKRVLSIIRSECDRMKKLIEDMLFLASSDSAGWNLNLTEIQPDNFLMEVWENYQPYCKKEGLTLNLDLPEHRFSPIRADKQRLQQVFSILVDNAVSYAKDGKQIDLTVSQHTKQVSFWVIDHGPGIVTADKARIFERFYRSQVSRTDKTHTGLGLSIAKEIIGQHKGKLLVLDTPGGGCSMRVDLPAS